MDNLILFLEAISFGLAVGFMFIGLIGTIIPILPGLLLMWLSILVYALLENFKTIDPITFIIITLITIIAFTSDIWLSFIGAKKGGASGRSLIYGTIGSIIGLVAFSAVIPIIGTLLGSIVGYVAGILYGEYRKHGDWDLAVKAGLGGLTGWGIATALQFGAGLFIMFIFIWQVLRY